MVLVVIDLDAMLLCRAALVNLGKHRDITCEVRKKSTKKMEDVKEEDGGHE